MMNFKYGRGSAEKILKNFKIKQYSATRNYVNGYVSKLSPYITHGIMTLPEIYEYLNSNFNLNKDEKFLKELAWREFFYHVWKFKNDQIFTSINNDFINKKYHIYEMPLDIRNASTGLNFIDKTVMCLYESGYIHNHARMWLASYIVHFRKIDWRIGADWLYQHLIDGDLASNHLSWQWVAGTFSNKPYLFNAQNVAKYAPEDWNCNGSFFDDSYENLLLFAQSLKKIEGGPIKKKVEPELFKTPTIEIPFATTENLSQVWIIHPWNINKFSVESRSKKRVGVFFEEFHTKWPWSKKRWDFVINNMKLLCDELYWCEKSVPIINSHTEENPHIDFILKKNTNNLTFQKKPCVWNEQIEYCKSFTKFWKKTNASNVK